MSTMGDWPLTVTDRKNGPGSVPTISVTKNFGPSWVGEFMFGVGRGGVTIAPADDRATRKVTGINTPLLYADANTPDLIPSLVFGGIASVGTPVTTSVFGPFDQRFLIWQTMDNITKILLSITTVALAATLVVNGAGTAKVIGAASSGFTNSLSAAEKG